MGPELACIGDQVDNVFKCICYSKKCLPFSSKLNSTLIGAFSSSGRESWLQFMSYLFISTYTN